MSEVKWIKIVTDIFDDEKTLLIESMPEADSIIVIWFKLLCLAGKQNNSGVFLLNGRIAYTDEMFATIFRRPLNTVRLALKTFEDLGMIEIINHTVTIPNWGKHQSIEQIEARREYQRQYHVEYRKRQKMLAAGGSVDDKGSRKCLRNDGHKQPVNALDKIREDKIRLDKTREDKSNDIRIINDSFPERSDEPSETDGPAVFGIPLNDGTEYGVTQQEIEYYRGLYPCVNIEQAYRNMIGWSNSNPARRKTRKGVKRFINTWLAKEQDKGQRPPNSGFGVDRRNHTVPEQYGGGSIV